MEWINPRDYLPRDGELIWALQIQNRGDYKERRLPAAEVFIAIAKLDNYGVIKAHQINHKGFECGMFYFYEWAYQGGWSSIDTYALLDAWMPFKEFPQWDHINISESIDILKDKPSLKEGRERDKTQEIIDEATKYNNSFISIKDHIPAIDGLYVVATQSGVFLNKYEKENCTPWHAHNGEKVLAWYPVPNHYSA